MCRPFAHVLLCLLFRILVYLVLAWSVRRRNPLLRLKRPWVRNNLEVQIVFGMGRITVKNSWVCFVMVIFGYSVPIGKWPSAALCISHFCFENLVLIEIFSTCLQTLLEEAVHQKVVMEELNDRCEVLMELSACSWVRDSTVQLQATYTNLLTTVQVCVWKYLPFVIVVDFCDRFCLFLLPNETILCDVDNDVCEHLKI